MIEELTPKDLETPENLRYSYLDKFQVLEGPMELPPNKCAGCGFAIYEKAHKYIDWNFALEFYGQVVLCVNCFRQAANQLNYMDPKQTAELIQKKREVSELNFELMNEVKRLRDALASLGLIGIVADDLSLADVGAEDRERSEPVDHGSSDEAKSGSDESNDESGSADLSGDDTLQQLLGDSI